MAKSGRAPFQIRVSNAPPTPPARPSSPPLHILQSLGGWCGRQRERERGEQGLHQGCSLDRANKSRPVTCSMAPFEERGKFGQSEEKGGTASFQWRSRSQPAIDRR
ncbi:hypothetical protein VZT92_005873 [Zoarces viviparus]|uniref:Uncharacterized protein n=1 Tax=Zoarces viviparus TaxID=48416 RepID=A0AAW1FN46_ZOAVI